MENWTIVLEPDEGGLHAFIPELPGCHSWGKTQDEAVKNIKEGTVLYVEAALEQTPIIIVEPDGDTFYAHCPALPEVHTQGDTRDEAIQNARDAIKAALRVRERYGQK